MRGSGGRWRKEKRKGTDRLPDVWSLSSYLTSPTMITAGDSDNVPVRSMTHVSSGHRLARA
eukprot:1084727-Rhodomonas_salina.1